MKYNRIVIFRADLWHSHNYNFGDNLENGRIVQLFFLILQVGDVNKKYYFMAGLPRSGSTLLKSIINQNPDVHTEPVSPILELTHYNNKYYADSEQYLKLPKT